MQSLTSLYQGRGTTPLAWWWVVLLLLFFSLLEQWWFKKYTNNLKQNKELMCGLPLWFKRGGKEHDRARWAIQDFKGAPEKRELLRGPEPQRSYELFE